MRTKVQKLVLSGMFLCIGMGLPFLTSQIKEIGDTILPMHFPVMLCGVICGYKYGFVVGLILPILRAICFSMPPLYPNSVWMATELATYGLVIGFLYLKLPKNKCLSLYVSLVVSMICGRIVWGISKAFLLGLSNKAFTLAMFVSGGIIDAILGIILQLIFIPCIVKLVERKIQ
jgi:hypothetical protein